MNLLQTTSLLISARGRFILNAGNSLQVTGDKIRMADPDLKSALIVPGKHCILIVSGKKVSSPIQIAPEDDVTWRGAHRN